MGVCAYFTVFPTFLGWASDKSEDDGCLCLFPLSSPHSWAGPLTSQKTMDVRAYFHCRPHIPGLGPLTNQTHECSCLLPLSSPFSWAGTSDSSERWMFLPTSIVFPTFLGWDLSQFITMDVPAYFHCLPHIPGLGPLTLHNDGCSCPLPLSFPRSWTRPGGLGCRATGK
jgi:hypothetical protein